MANQDNTIANWMIMAYIAADDVLADFAVGSLHQLKRLASDDAHVVVAAQFDANGKQNIGRIVFDAAGSQGESIQYYKKDEIANTSMANPAVLADFINWAYAQRKANHYCLVLWGHGPELLADDYPDRPDGTRAKKFLTPCDVKHGLAQTKLTREGHKFDIFAVDACNMSMMELACEVTDYAEFLVASQDEVPDFSFPYDKLFALGKVKNYKEIEKTCRKIPEQYISAYQDYTQTQTTQTASITLSSLALANTREMTGLVRRLADAFKTNEESKRKAIIKARANSRGFVAGLYVDLYDFCQQLNSELGLRSISDQNLVSTCEEICDAIQSREKNPLIVANQVSQDRNCHGISIYFPYQVLSVANTTDKSLVKDRTGVISRPTAKNKAKVAEMPDRNGREASQQGLPHILTQDGLNGMEKGGTDLLNKGGTDLLNKGGTDLLNKLRRQRIEETERYYGELRLAKETRWDEFIRYYWSRWLAEETEAGIKSPEAVSDSLDQHYSAQQCAFNLLALCKKLEKNQNSSDGRAGGEPADTIVNKKLFYVKDVIGKRRKHI
jgi:hypothetical protein